MRVPHEKHRPPVHVETRHPRAFWRRAFGSPGRGGIRSRLFGLDVIPSPGEGFRIRCFREVVCRMNYDLAKRASVLTISRSGAIPRTANEAKHSPGFDVIGVSLISEKASRFSTRRRVSRPERGVFAGFERGVSDAFEAPMRASPGEEPGVRALFRVRGDTTSPRVSVASEPYPLRRRRRTDTSDSM